MRKLKKDKKVNRAFKALNDLYATIPDTKGCMEHINKPKDEGGCGGWCCQFQNPHVMYVEFLNTWKYVLKNWDFEKVADLVERALRNYLTQKPTKGCVFWDKETKLCTQHQTRPYNCRVYGITPPEEMQPRIERLRIIYKNRIDAVIKDQCPLVSTVNGKTVTVKDTAEWFKKLTEIEASLGIKKKDMNDKGSGTYMTYHDHILLHIMPDTIMKQLEFMRVHGENHEKETVIAGIMTGFRNKIEALLNGREEGEDEEEKDSNINGSSTDPVIEKEGLTGRSEDSQAS